ncbi:MAG TPA: ribosome biogenesis GTP-binding protein YihA/YsxC [Geobacterales bacterium]|nr:ribosome biogenesis GTP-binding protein YihA/YsxC [Geobacterales bacterium]
MEREKSGAGEPLRVKTARFVISAAASDQFPALQQPEFAFAGRSNVGKSSLINLLVNRKSLVRTSSTPGRTQLINFFLINELFYFVDLPGFGYARVPAAIQRSWGPMVEGYLAGSHALKGVALLVDVRRTPQAEERQLVAWLQHYGIPFLVVVTKCDKVSRNERAKQQRMIAATLGVDGGSVLPVSTLSRDGRDELLTRIHELLQGSEEAGPSSDTSASSSDQEPTAS